MKYSSISDLSVMQMLCKACSHPQFSIKTIHVAGTNGKGSVSMKIAKALELSGHKVGQYTSPHLHTFCERIRIGDQLISEKEVVFGLKRLFALTYLLKLTPSFFEIATLLAFEYFRQEKVEVVVIETGLGGRLDATNVIQPLLAIITSISKEHTQILGESLAEIAKEKAGILKKDIPVVLGPHAMYTAILDQAKLMRSPVHAIDGNFPFYDLENQAISLKALELLKSHFPALSKNVIDQGVQQRPSCRFEFFHGAILDVAHNPHGFQRLLEALTFHFPDKLFRFVIGMCEDKDIKQCLKIIAPKASHFYFVASDRARAASLDILDACLKEVSQTSRTLGLSIFEGIMSAHEHINPSKEMVVICGSFYIMEEAKQTLADCLLINC